MSTVETPATIAAHKLAILQAYPLGTLEVKTPYGRGVLMGISFSQSREIHEAEITKLPHISRGAMCQLADLTPYLNNFAALCTPLADGTVPAVEVAKLAVSDTVHAQGGSFGGYGPEGDAVYAEYFHNREYRRVRIMPGFNVSDDGEWATNQAAVIDYMRSRHFALPVNGRPLIEGVDYLPK